jgi:DNA-binding MurR/RpiR family transcriptional regulator
VIARLGTPLAAAAAVVLAVTGTWFAPVAQVSTVVLIGPPQRVGESVTVVSFAKTAHSPATANEALTFGYMTLGSSPMGQTREESPL